MVSDEQIPPYGEADVRKYAYESLIHARNVPEGFTSTHRGEEKRIAWKTLKEASTWAARMCAFWVDQGDPFAKIQASKWAAAFAVLETRKKRLLKEKQDQVFQMFS
jgi:hypothetical protein